MSEFDSRHYIGYVFHFDREKFADAALSDLDEPLHIATASVEVDDWPRRAVEPCLISADGNIIDHIALVRLGDMIVTGEYRIVFHHITPVAPVTLPLQAREHVSRISTHRCSRCPPAIWVELVDQLMQASHGPWTDLMLRLHQSRQRRDAPGYDIMAMERDAVGVALEIAAFDRSTELEKREAVSVTPTSYITRLAQASRGKTIEDRLIDHDALTFDDLRVQRTDVIGTVVFEKPGTGERLYVTNANRTKIESTLGVDLVYFNETYRSFVMVQYKRMRPEGGDYVYRFEQDVSYAKELERMLAYEAKLRPRGADGPTDYRLDPGVFYFKLCADTFFDPLAVGMIDGMYFPVTYWHTILQSAGTSAFVGKRGARRVSFDSSGRCLNNDLFTKLVRFGWVGSRHADYQMLSERITASLEEKRSVLLTHTQKRANERVGLRPPPRRMRRR